MPAFLDRIGATFTALRKSVSERWPAARRMPHATRTLAGVAMTPDVAITIAAVWACIRYLSQTIGMLPWRVHRANGSGVDVIDSSPIDWLIFKRPNPEWSSFQFRETLLHWALRWGNGYAEIERDVVGRIIALWPIHPERVHVMRDPDTGKLFYRVTNGASPTVDIEAADMYHLRGFGDGPVGVNVIDYAAQSLGWAKAVQLFGASFFGNGANISGVVTKKGRFEPGPLNRLKAEFKKLYTGIFKSNKTVFLDDEMDFKATGVDPINAQMVEANYLQIEEVCRWFGVPPHKVAHLLRATFSNIENQSIEVVTDSIRPWAVRLQDEADFKLFGQNRTNLYTLIDLKSLLRGDFKSQQEGFQIMRNCGVLSANDWLREMNMNAIPAAEGGDKYTMQIQYTTLKQIGVASTPPTTPIDPEPPAPDKAEAEAQIRLLALAEELEAAHV